MIRLRGADHVNHVHSRGRGSRHEAPNPQRGPPAAKTEPANAVFVSDCRRAGVLKNPEAEMSAS